MSLRFRSQGNRGEDGLRKLRRVTHLGGWQHEPGQAVGPQSDRAPPLGAAGWREQPTRRSSSRERVISGTSQVPAVPVKSSPTSVGSTRHCNTCRRGSSWGLRSEAAEFAGTVQALGIPESALEGSWGGLNVLPLLLTWPREARPPLGSWVPPRRPFGETVSSVITGPHLEGHRPSHPFSLR